MPELPEVEVIRRGLVREVRGRAITQVEVVCDRAIRRRPDADAFRAALDGTTVTGVDRRGKFLLLRLDTRDVLVVHLGMSGQLRIADGFEARARHTHVVWSLEDGRELRFVDPRTFGQTFVTTPAHDGGAAELAHLGIEPFGDGLSPARLASALAGRRGRVKGLLMNQRVIAGLGNVYSDEILWRARLRWDRVAADLSVGELHALHAAIVGTLTEAVRARGSSLADAQYVDLYGRPGRFQHRHAVYAREGAPCPRCDTPVVRERTAGRSTFSCPTCQP